MKSCSTNFSSGYHGGHEAVSSNEVRDYDRLGTIGLFDRCENLPFAAARQRLFAPKRGKNRPDDKIFSQTAPEPVEYGFVNFGGPWTTRLLCESYRSAPGGS